MPEKFRSSDERWMQRAIDLALDSVGLASPNPAVGCVLIHDDTVIGEGFHAYDDKDHAEIVALKQAGDRAAGSTAYITMEPCSHQGRTGPCADALIRAGVARVVAAVQDPNPEVSGRGLARLQAAGVSITMGVRESDARRINDAFAKFIRTGKPFVTLKAGLTLDGRIAPPPTGEHATGSIHWITSDPSREVVQQLRHAADAVLTGIGTVLSDDPQLTDRSGRPRRRPLLRVVLDTTLRFPTESQLARDANKDVLIFHAPGANTRQVSKQAAFLQSMGVQVEQVMRDGATDRVSLPAVLTRLAEMEITNVLFEAGSHVNGAALAAGIVDKLFFFYAPAIYGDSAVPVVRSVDANMYSAMRLQNYRLRELGEDFAVEGYLRDPWEAL